MRECIILAGGKGLRLKGHSEVPKPFLIVKEESGETLLESQLKWLLAYDFEHVILALSRENFKYMRLNYSKFLSLPFLDTSIEEENLGTGGAVKRALEFIEEPNFYCFNVDDVCYSEDTDFLTRNGWKLLKDIDLGTEILTFNKKIERTEFQPLQRKLIKSYAGSMVHFHTQHIDLLVTPEHRILTRGRNRRKLLGRGPYKIDYWHEYPASSLLTNSEIWIPTAYPQQDKPDYPIDDEWIRLVAWILTEGSYPMKDKRVCISQSMKANPLFVNQIKKILMNLHLQFSYSSGMNFKIRSEDSFRIKGILPKKDEIPRRWIDHFSNRQLFLLFSEMYKGDGTKKTNVYTSFDPHLLDQIQEILTRLGQKSSRGKNVIYFHEKGRNWEAVRPERRKSILYKGRIVCPTVENSFVVIRRKGKVSISGNCFYNPGELFNSQRSLNVILVKQAILPFGAVEFDTNQRVDKFVEKPVIDKFVSCGHYVFSRKSIEPLLPEIGDLELTLLKDLAFNKALYVYPLKGKWITINTFKELLEARGRMTIEGEVS